jgi:sulfite exporter TauE/SafE
MKLQLIKDGRIQGWAVATAFTLVTIILLILGFFVKCISNGWVSFGDRYETIYIGSLVIWLGYKGAKAVVDKIQEAKENIAKIQNGGGQ